MSSNKQLLLSYCHNVLFTQQYVPALAAQQLTPSRGTLPQLFGSLQTPISASVVLQPPFSYLWMHQLQLHSVCLVVCAFKQFCHVMGGLLQFPKLSLEDLKDREGAYHGPLPSAFNNCDGFDNKNYQLSLVPKWLMKGICSNASSLATTGFSVVAVSTSNGALPCTNLVITLYAYHQWWGPQTLPAEWWHLWWRHLILPTCSNNVIDCNTKVVDDLVGSTLILMSPY